MYYLVFISLIYSFLTYYFIYQKVKMLITQKNKNKAQIFSYFLCKPSVIRYYKAFQINTSSAYILLIIKKIYAICKNKFYSYLTDELLVVIFEMVMTPPMFV